MKNNLELAKQVVDSVYVITNMPKLNTRRHPHPQLRGAITVALSKWFYSDVIGEALNRERTVVNHYKTKHEGNLQYWDCRSSGLLLAAQRSFRAKDRYNRQTD